MATMQDVAKKARVSVTTVSRVLNGDPRVNAATRARVEHWITTMGYQPNLMARSLRRQTSRVVGLVVDTLKNPFTAELSQGLAAHLDAAGYQLILADTQRQASRGPDMVQMLAQRGVDGILYAAGWEDGPETLAVACGLLAKSGVPTVMVGNYLRTVPSVFVDHRQGTRDAVAYLHQLGHQYLVFVSGAQDTETSRLRQQGFLQAAAEWPQVSATIYPSRGSLAGAAAIVHDILTHAPQTTAIVAASDYLAAGILSGLFDHACRVPQDMSVIGFDNVQMSQFLCPALTTMDADIPQLATLACEHLALLLQEPAQPPPPSPLIPRLVVRHSVGPPR